MLAWALRVALLAVVAFAAVTAALLGRRYGLTLPAQALVFVAAFAAVPLLLTVFAFALAWVYRSPGPAEFRIGPFAYLRCVLVEAFWFSILYLFMQAFPRLALAKEDKQRAGDRPAVLLVPGFTCNAGVWSGFSRALRRQGYAVFTMTLEPVYGPIDAYADAVAQRVKALYAASGGHPVALIGHSMGGLIGRAYLRQHGGADVSRLITLGTPHHGTALAPMGYGHNAREMRRMSEWLGGLSAFEEGGYPAPVTSIFSYHDNIVAPQRSSELAGATNVALGGMGHMTLLFSPRVVEIVARELAADQR